MSKQQTFKRGKVKTTYSTPPKDVKIVEVDGVSQWDREWTAAIAPAPVKKCKPRPVARMNDPRDLRINSKPLGGKLFPREKPPRFYSWKCSAPQLPEPEDAAHQHRPGLEDNGDGTPYSTQDCIGWAAGRV